VYQKFPSTGVEGNTAHAKADRGGLGKLLFFRGPALARRARPWVRHPEVLAGPNSTSPDIGWGGMVYSFKSFWGH
jgi:hypothetical protein